MYFLKRATTFFFSSLVVVEIFEHKPLLIYHHFFHNQDWIYSKHTIIQCVATFFLYTSNMLLFVESLMFIYEYQKSLKEKKKKKKEKMYANLYVDNLVTGILSSTWCTLNKIIHSFSSCFAVPIFSPITFTYSTYNFD